MNTSLIIRKTIQRYDLIAEAYSKKWENTLLKEELDAFIKNLSGKEILDVGCGPGRDSKYFYERGFNVTGIDLSESFLKIASLNAPNVKFIKEDMRNLSFLDNSFDGLWVCASFLHIPKCESGGTLSEFHRVLKKKGIIYICVKRGENEHLLERKLGGGTFTSFYQEKEFVNLLEQSGFNTLNTNIRKKEDSIWINYLGEEK